MALHPQARRAVENAAGAQPVTDPAFDIAATREADRAAAAAQAKVPVAEVRDVDAGGVPARLYLPEGYDAVVVHAHGGGFVLNDVEVHDAAVRRFAAIARTAVLSVDYRRPPEHPFPAAPDDLGTAVRWLGSRPELADLPTFAHGDSAGGNLALVTALRHPGRFTGVALIYPFLDPTASFSSYTSGVAAGFEPSEAAWYWQQYAASAADLTDPDLAPLLSDRLGTLPPTLVTTAEHDPLRDEGEAYAAALVAAGNEVTARRWLGQIHTVWGNWGVLDASKQAHEWVGAFCRRVLA